MLFDDSQHCVGLGELKHQYQDSGAYCISDKLQITGFQHTFHFFLAAVVAVVAGYFAMLCEIQPIMAMVLAVLGGAVVAALLTFVWWLFACRSNSRTWLLSENEVSIEGRQWHVAFRYQIELARVSFYAGKCKAGRLWLKKYCVFVGSDDIPYRAWICIHGAHGMPNSLSPKELGTLIESFEHPVFKGSAKSVRMLPEELRVL